MLTAALNGGFFFFYSVNEAAQMMTPPHKEMLQPHPPPHALRHTATAAAAALKQSALSHTARPLLMSVQPQRDFSLSWPYENELFCPKRDNYLT